MVGLSLPQAFAVLAPQHPLSVQAELAEHYRSDFPGKRQQPALHDPLYPGIAEVVAALAGRDDMLLGIATGKSQRGVARLLEREGWQGHFVTIQTADENPSKPDPSMILSAMAQTGVEPHATLMIGDTTYDIEMARNAGVGAIGVAWGYHAPERLQLRRRRYGRRDERCAARSNRCTAGGTGAGCDVTGGKNGRPEATRRARPLLQAVTVAAAIPLPLVGSG